MVQSRRFARRATRAKRGAPTRTKGGLSLHRVTAAAFAVLLVLSGIGTLMARQGPQPTVQSVQLTDDRAEAPPAVGGQVEPEIPHQPASEETIVAASPAPVEVVV